jgi:outer membrane protein assembly factor BamE
MCPFCERLTLMRLYIAVLSVLLASCSAMSLPSLGSLSPYQIPVRQGNMVTPEMVEQVKVGMTGAQVRAILGTPLVQDPFHANRWDYFYSLKQGGKLVDQQRLTLFFRDDALERIEDSNMPGATVATGQAGGTKER